MSQRKNMKSWADVQCNIQPVLISKETANGLQNIVVRPYFDMAVIYTIVDDGFEKTDRRKVCVIDDLSYWEIDEEVLHEQALLNLKADAVNYELTPIESLLKELVDEMYIPESYKDVEPPIIPLYVLTNRKKLFGASILLNTELLKEISKGHSYYILPSSIHEILIFKDEEKVMQDELDQMIRDINERNLLPQEQLASHSLYYDSQKEELRIWKDMQI